MNKKPIVYIASPYSLGDPDMNTLFQQKIFNRLMDDGVVIPYAPLWTHYFHLETSRSYYEWVLYHNSLIESRVFDYCLRLNADLDSYYVSQSNGADEEVKLFKQLGIKTVVVDQDYNSLGNLIVTSDEAINHLYYLIGLSSIES